MSWYHVQSPAYTYEEWMDYVLVEAYDLVDYFYVEADNPSKAKARAVRIARHTPECSEWNTWPNPFQGMKARRIPQHELDWLEREAEPPTEGFLGSGPPEAEFRSLTLAEHQEWERGWKEAAMEEAS